MSDRVSDGGSGLVEAAPAGLRSAVYVGTLTHGRSGPGVAREFSYRVAMPLIDLDELGAVVAAHRLWSDRHPAPVWFRRSDFFGDPRAPLGEAVRDLVAARTGARPEGPVSMLANLRTWGWLFNPISLYFCYPPGGHRVEHLVAEVENTPWHERCQYVVGAPGRHRFPKAMHVSPFLPMDVDYELRYSNPGTRLVVHLEVLRGEERLFRAMLSLQRRAIDHRQLGRVLWNYPAMTHRVSSGIYAQAARLGLRGAPFYAHPRSRGPEANADVLLREERE